jgi:hypothetical protein
MSECGLARITGISQPHIHNVLKGSRLLSMDLADQMLRRLRMDLRDLLIREETGVEGERQPADAGQCRMVSLLEGWIGREYPFPKTVSQDRYPFAGAAIHRLEDPVAAKMAPDILRPPLFSSGWCCWIAPKAFA